MTPLGALGRGVLAGAVGVLAMDSLGYVSQVKRGGGTPPLEYEFGVEEDWEKVPAPGQVGKRLVEGFTQRPLPPERAPLVNGVVHWGYGIAWAGVYALAAGSSKRPRAVWGLPFGAAVWLAAYAVLPTSGLYRPISQYDATTLGQDLLGHLAYGGATGFVFRLLAPRGRGS